MNVHVPDREIFSMSRGRGESLGTVVSALSGSDTHSVVSRHSSSCFMLLVCVCVVSVCVCFSWPDAAFLEGVGPQRCSDVRSYASTGLSSVRFCTVFGRKRLFPRCGRERWRTAAARLLRGVPVPPWEHRCVPRRAFLCPVAGRPASAAARRRAQKSHTPHRCEVWPQSRPSGNYITMNEIYLNQKGRRTY